MPQQPSSPTPTSAPNMPREHSHRRRRYCRHCRPVAADPTPIEDRALSGMAVDISATAPKEQIDLNFNSMDINDTVSDPPDNYECAICCEEFEFADGVFACDEHPLCNACAIQIFKVALNSVEQFPASCCVGTILPPKAFQHLLGDETTAKYRARLAAHDETPALRVHCANPECAVLIPKHRFMHLTQASIAYCSNHHCDTATCVGCNGVWESEEHICQAPEDNDAELPPYTTECRIKKCPNCRAAVELKEACNHMTCAYCGIEFCFVCLLPWQDFHPHEGCPVYNDAEEGYDDDGFERMDRGLHVRTGLNREGKNRDDLRPDLWQPAPASLNAPDNGGFEAWNHNELPHLAFRPRRPGFVVLNGDQVNHPAPRPFFAVNGDQVNNLPSAEVLPPAQIWDQIQAQVNDAVQLAHAHAADDPGIEVMVQNLRNLGFIDLDRPQQGGKDLDGEVDEGIEPVFGHFEGGAIEDTIEEFPHEIAYLDDGEVVVGPEMTEEEFMTEEGFEEQEGFYDVLRRYITATVNEDEAEGLADPDEGYETGEGQNE